MCLAVMLQGCTYASTDKGETITERTDDIFDTSYVHQINIEISEEDWNDLLNNPLEKTKYKVNLTIDGNEVNEVSFATKGNTSLSSVAADSNSDRYSFKINFSKYDKQQTYQGLKKLNLSNIYSDPTYMKDYLSYQLFNEVGALSSRCSYVWLTVNGEDFGLYLAIEEVDQAFLDENTESEGTLYKPEAEMLGNIGNGMKPGENGNDPQGEGNKWWQPGNGNGNMLDNMTPTEGFNPFGQDGENGTNGFNPFGQNGNGFGPGDSSGNQFNPGDGNGFNPGNMTPPDGTNPFSGEDGNDPGQFNPENIMPENKPGGFNSSNGASLVYTDDQISSYSDIFDNAETDVTEEDEYRVIEALKNLSEGNIEESVDVDNTIRYFVAHNFVMNYDSYTGTMLHNYYLYENDGLLTMIPWDYNLAFGAFAMGARNDATSLINQGIDSPLSNASESDRPMWSWITDSEEYLEQYHAVYKEFITEYFDSGKFEEEFNRVVKMIREYVAKDPSAFYSVGEFDTATEQLKKFCLLRAESISKQLDGTLATVSSQQNSADRVDASGLNISSMGSFGGGGNGFNPGNFFGSNNGFNPQDSFGQGNGFEPGDSSGNQFNPGGGNGFYPGNSFGPGNSQGNSPNPGNNNGFGPGNNQGNSTAPGSNNGSGNPFDGGNDSDPGDNSQEPIGGSEDIQEL